MIENEQPQDDQSAGEQLRPEDEAEDRRREPQPPEDLESDPAYNPSDEGLRDLKGG